MRVAIIAVLSVIVITASMVAQPSTKAAEIGVRPVSAPTVHRTPFEYRHIELWPAEAEPANAPQVRPKQIIAPPAAVERALEPVMYEEPKSVQNPAVAACVGKPAGSACSYEMHAGTCITPAFSPVTCVPH